MDCFESMDGQGNLLNQVNLFKNQFKLSKQEESGVGQVCSFVEKNLHS